MNTQEIDDPFVEILRAATQVEKRDGSGFLGRLISLDLQQTYLENALRIIEEVADTKIQGKEKVELKSKITLRAIDVPWDQALDVMLETSGCTSRRDSDGVHITELGKQLH